MYYILCKRTLFFSFTYEIEKEKAKKKTVVSKEQMIELVSMYFIDRKRKREREKETDEKKTEQTSFIHSFREKSQDAKEEKNLSFFFCAELFRPFSPLLFIVVIYGVLSFFLAYCVTRQRHQYSKSTHVIH